MADGGSFDAVPPPISGLGNFKGVMLCNRPVDEPASKGGGGGGDGQVPFKSMVSATVNDQLGLNPANKVGHEGANVKTRGPSAALRRHVRWLKELQEQMRGERDAVEQDELEAAEKKKRISEQIAKHREAVRTMMEARDAGADMTEIAASKKEKKSAAAKPSKPLWAMTEKEKDHFEEEEADDLINFAEGLDYDKYVSDLEFRQGMAALADRAGKLQKMQDSFKDDLVNQFNTKVDEDGSTSAGGSPRGINLEEGLDGQSILGDQRSEYSVGSRMSMGQERYGQGPKDWDSSTNCGDNETGISREVRDAADMVFESNSNLKQIHSKASIARVIEKNTIREEPEEHLDLIETMKRDGPVKAPVITSSEDTQVRLHREVAASQLPYIYRSPAV